VQFCEVRALNNDVAFHVKRGWLGETRAGDTGYLVASRLHASRTAFHPGAAFHVKHECAKGLAANRAVIARSYPPGPEESAEK
jgi:hypothetical protein